MTDKRRSTFVIAMAVFILLGLALLQSPKMLQLAFAHTFSGNENAQFIAKVGVIRTELRLINSTASTNSSAANEHAKIAVEHLSVNDTNELKEKNQRIGTDLPNDLMSLQNMTASISPTNTTGISAIRQKVNDADSLLGEAQSVRIEAPQLRNSTVYGLAVAHLLNETLERYGETLDITANTSSSASNSTTSVGDNTSNVTIANQAAYESTRGLVNMTKELFNQTKRLANATITTNPNFTKVDNDLKNLTSQIENKSAYPQVVGHIYNTTYPDLNSVLNLGLAKVNATRAIQDAMSAKG